MALKLYKVCLLDKTNWLVTSFLIFDYIIKNQFLSSKLHSGHVTQSKTSGIVIIWQGVSQVHILNLIPYLKVEILGEKVYISLYGYCAKRCILERLRFKLLKELTFLNQLTAKKRYQYLNSYFYHVEGFLLFSTSVIIALKTVLHSLEVDRIVKPFSWIIASQISAMSSEHPKSEGFMQKLFAGITSCSDTGNLLSISPFKLGAIYKAFGLPLGHSPFLTGQILWLFHMSFTSSNSVCIKPIKQNRITSKWNGLLRLKFPVSHKSLKKFIHQLNLARLSFDHQASIRWFLVEGPNLKLLIPAISSSPSFLKYFRIPATATYLNLCLLLLNEVLTVSQQHSWQNNKLWPLDRYWLILQTTIEFSDCSHLWICIYAPWIANPNGFNSSYPSMCQLWLGPVEI